MVFDSHTHIHFPAYDKDREAVILRAKEAGVKMITVGTQTSSSLEALKLAHQYNDDIWATVGFHPNHLDENWHHDKNEQSSANQEKFDIKKLEKLAKDERVVAIGECGLDYYRIISDESKIKDKQKRVFSEQAELAQDLNKSLMIHCRPSKGTDDAYQDLLAIISNLKLTIPKIIHFYVGGLEITKKLVEAGFYFTFGGVVTFTKDYELQIKYIPIERVLLETDAPYVAPVSNRGKRNEPSFILETAKKIAEIKGISYDEVVEITTKNAKEVFRI